MKGSEVPIRKIKAGKKRWLLDCRYVGGVREFYKTKEDAETAREAKLIEVRNHGAAALSLSSDDRLDFVRARDRLSVLDASISQAVEFYEEHHKKTERLKLSVALDRLCAEKKTAGLRERSIKTFRSTLEAFSLTQDDPLVSSVTRDSISTWLSTDGWQPATVRTKRIDVQTFFRAALARGWSTQDPSKGLERVILDDKPPGILTVDQCRRLLNSARTLKPEFVGYIALALFAGIRPEELEQMCEGDLNIERSFVEVRAEVAKARKRRLVELSENCKAWLRIGAELPPRNTQRRMNNARIAAGLEGYQRKRVKGKDCWVHLPGEPWPHDAMRHSFGSYHVAMHGSADKTATQMGHRSTDMLFRHYRELVTKEQALEFWAILP